MGSTLDEVSLMFEEVILAEAAAAQGGARGRALVDGLSLRWSIKAGGCRSGISGIGSGDEASLTRGLDPNSTLVVREILRRLAD